ncbi:MAG: hypothetical protein ACE5FD_01265 [Anaerolineae bacterium]
MAITKVSNLNSLYADIYERALFVARDMNLMRGLVTVRSARGYMTRRVSTRPQLTAVAKAEGVDFANPTTFGRTAGNTFSPAVAFAQALLTDEDAQTDPDNAVNDVSREGGLAIAAKVDTDLVGNFSSFNVDKGSSGAGLTIAKCAAGLAVMRNDSVQGPFYFVLHPYGWHDVWTELGQPASNKALLGDVANQALLDYYAGSFLGANWFVSANISADATPDAVSGVFNREALMLDIREGFTMEPERDASLKATEFNFSIGYAHGVYRDSSTKSYGIALTHDATEPS